MLAIGKRAKVKATNLVGVIVQCNGHACKLLGRWYHQEELEIQQDAEDVEMQPNICEGMFFVGSRVRVKASGSVGTVVQTNGHACKLLGKWFHREKLVAHEGDDDANMELRDSDGEPSVKAASDSTMPAALNAFNSERATILEKIISTAKTIGDVHLLRLAIKRVEAVAQDYIARSALEVDVDEIRELVELRRRPALVRQLTFDFSDENLREDTFMRGLIESEKEACFVPISKLLNSRHLRRMGCSGVAEIVKAVESAPESSGLELSPTRDAVRRLGGRPIPPAASADEPCERDERTVKIERFPVDDAAITEDAIKELCSTFGATNHIWLVRRRSCAEAPLDILGEFVGTAEVEFESAEAAVAAATREPPPTWRGEPLRIKSLVASRAEGGSVRGVKRPRDDEEATAVENKKSRREEEAAASIARFGRGLILRLDGVPERVTWRVIKDALEVYGGVDRVDFDDRLDEVQGLVWHAYVRMRDEKAVAAVLQALKPTNGCLSLATLGLDRDEMRPTGPLDNCRSGPPQDHSLVENQSQPPLPMLGGAAEAHALSETELSGPMGKESPVTLPMLGGAAETQAVPETEVDGPIENPIPPLHTDDAVADAQPVVNAELNGQAAVQTESSIAVPPDLDLNDGPPGLEEPPGLEQVGASVQGLISAGDNAMVETAGDDEQEEKEASSEQKMEVDVDVPIDSVGLQEEKVSAGVEDLLAPPLMHPPPTTPPLSVVGPPPPVMMPPPGLPPGEQASKELEPSETEAAKSETATETASRPCAAIDSEADTRLSKWGGQGIRVVLVNGEEEEEYYRKRATDMEKRNSVTDGRKGRDNYRDGGYRDGGHRDGGYRDAGNSYRDGGYRDRGYRGGDYRDGGYKDGGYRDGGYRDRSFRDSGYRDAGYRDGGYREGSHRDAGGCKGRDGKGKGAKSNDGKGSKGKKDGRKNDKRGDKQEPRSLPAGPRPLAPVGPRSLPVGALHELLPGGTSSAGSLDSLMEVWRETS